MVKKSPPAFENIPWICCPPYCGRPKRLINVSNSLISVSRLWSVYGGASGCSFLVRVGAGQRPSRSIYARSRCRIIFTFTVSSSVRHSWYASIRALTIAPIRYTCCCDVTHSCATSAVVRIAPLRCECYAARSTTSGPDGRRHHRPDVTTFCAINRQSAPTFFCAQVPSPGYAGKT